MPLHSSLGDGVRLCLKEKKKRKEKKRKEKKRKRKEKRKFKDIIKEAKFILTL